VPSASAYKLPDLMAALDAHIAAVPVHANSSSSSSNSTAAINGSSSLQTATANGSAAADAESASTSNGENGSYATNGYTTDSYTVADVTADVADDDDDGLSSFGEPQIAPLKSSSAEQTVAAAAAAGSETAASETASTNGSSVNGSRGLNKRRALIEYVMLSGVNDTVECGHQLGALLQGKSVVVNLIPYNATLTLGDSFSEPTEEALITVSSCGGFTQHY
jgi:hypothetical protein